LFLRLAADAVALKLYRFGILRMNLFSGLSKTMGESREIVFHNQKVYGERVSSLRPTARVDGGPMSEWLMRTPLTLGVLK
jgi:hypothetical protein